jgi:hypothetical protein
MESFFKYTLGSKRYIWKKKQKEVKNNKSQQIEAGTQNPMRVDHQYIPKVSRSKLKDIAWSLDMDNR